jgi:hypothetical protein
MALEVEWLIEFVNVRGEYNELINWLIDNIEDVRDRQTNKEYFGRPRPYHFSAISQYARFRGMTNKWYLEIRGNKQVPTVRFSEQVPARLIVEFALKHT